MTDCLSIHGSTSSSSDIMTLTTAASSRCALSTMPRVRVLRLVRPHHTRRMFMVTGPESTPSFGFAVRGGKEFGTGFFVSKVEPNSEADLKGLLVGDQILCLNGFCVEDAVHKEFTRFVRIQDRITLKVRGIGLLPIRDKENGRLSWNVVNPRRISNTPSESSLNSHPSNRNSLYSAIRFGNLCRRDISIVLDVAPRTKLGLGICKGPEWKPGIFVQFTKKKSVARASGLRPGDQILSVNSIDFSDVLFSEAVAVMKSSNKLEIVVRPAAGCELFPGESSGYNSSASSVTGDQSPCRAEAKSKHLTVLSEEPVIKACFNCTRNAERMFNGHDVKQNVDVRKLTTAPTVSKEVNKTIIQLSENGTSINNTYVGNTNLSSRWDRPKKKGIPMKTSNPALSTVSFFKLVEESEINRIDCGSSHNKQFENEKHKSKNDFTVSTTLPAAAAERTTLSASANDPHKASKPALYGTFANICCPNEIRAKSSNKHDLSSAGSSLSSAITEELKKRREKQSFSKNSNNTNSIVSHSSFRENSSKNMTDNQQSKATMKSTAQQQQFQHHQLQKVNCHEQGSITSTLKCVPQCNGNSSINIAGSNISNCKNKSNLDQHSALMDEFKRAHQRMFKNGFHENDRMVS